MAKTTKAVTPDKKSNSNAVEKKSWTFTKQHKIVLGSLLVLFSIALLLAFISFYIYGQADQSAVNQLSDRNETVQNWLGKFATHLKIRESGLWQVQGLNGKPLDCDSIENLRALSLAE